MHVMKSTVLQRKYNASYTLGAKQNQTTFSVVLECEQNPDRFHMLVVPHASFLNGALNVCNWPVQEWTYDQVRTCVNIFHDEYLPLCNALSEIVHDDNLQEVSIFNSSAICHTSSTTPCATIMIIDALWANICNPAPIHTDMNQIWEPCTTILLDGQFGVCDAFHDCSYIEDQFPFIGAIDAFGNRVDSLTSLYEKHLPSLMALAKAHSRT